MTLTNEQIFGTLVLPYLNHAVRMYEASYASSADIDAAMRFGCGYPTGPLTVIDELGAAAVRDQLAARYAETGDHLHQPAELLEKLAAEGRTFAEEASAARESAAPELKQEIRKVGVVGTGTMASGIAQVFAQAGLRRRVRRPRRGQDRRRPRLHRQGRSSKLVEKGKLDEDAKADVLDRLTGSTEREALGDVDIVVEAIAEDLDIKTELYKDLDRICKPGAILATTTSSLPITKLGEATDRPESVIGMHFFNPATIMKLVEVVTTGRHGRRRQRDRAGAVRQRRQGRGLLRRPVGLHRQLPALPLPQRRGHAPRVGRRHRWTRSTTRSRSRRGFPMGPFQLLDVVGNDVSLAIQQELYAEFKEPGFAPAATARAEGRRGRPGSQDRQGLPRLQLIVRRCVVRRSGPAPSRVRGRSRGRWRRSEPARRAGVAGA